MKTINLKILFSAIFLLTMVALFVIVCKRGGAVDDAPVTVEQAEEFAEELHIEADTLVLLLDSIRRGEGPFNVMERLMIPRGSRQRILFELANETDFTSLRVGEKFAAVYCIDTLRLHEFIYFQDVLTTHRIQISYDDEGHLHDVAYVLDERPHTARHRLIRGTLTHPTLDAELRSMGLAPRVAQVATNVLECKIAFRTDARIGDTFEILLREIVFEDTAHGAPAEQILHSRTELLFVSYAGERVRPLRAYKFFDYDKSSYNAHYTEEGEALIFTGIRFPLDRIHITSRFGMRRHPVTGRNAMHNGVDYRARVGTPVYAVADGRVTKSTFDNASGHYVAIRHNDGYSSYYLHLSRRSVNVGAQVRARQVIGLSGNTGLSAGPHLHLGIRQPNGAWMNPLNKRMVAAPKLEGEKLERLREQIAEIRAIYAEAETEKLKT